VESAPARVRKLLSSEHFSVDGTLIEAWGQHEELRCRRTLNGVLPPDAQLLDEIRVPSETAA
jgi:hypothetical protein